MKQFFAAQGTSKEVSTPAEFEAALQDDTVETIVVTKSIVLGDKIDSNKRMIPTLFRTPKTIEGKEGSLTFWGAVQLGADVTIKNISMQFVSTNALNAVPDRNIYLNGYSLTLDNVSTQARGAAGTGAEGIGGTEKELLPSIIGGSSNYWRA